MVVEFIIWVVSFLVVSGLLGIVVYQLMCLSDLEFDYINPFDSSARINRFVIPEFVLQGGLSVLFLFSGHWIMFLLNTPVIYHHVRLYLQKQYFVDVTEIFNLLSHEKRYRLGKLGFYFFLLFVIIYRLVVAAVSFILEHDKGLDGEFFGANI